MLRSGGKRDWVVVVDDTGEDLLPAGHDYVVGTADRKQLQVCGFFLDRVAVIGQQRGPVRVPVLLRRWCLLLGVALLDVADGSPERARRDGEHLGDPECRFDWCLGWRDMAQPGADGLEQVVRRDLAASRRARAAGPQALDDRLGEHRRLQVGDGAGPGEGVLRDVGGCQYVDATRSHRDAAGPLTSASSLCRARGSST
jgi:hypothetical protein